MPAEPRSRVLVVDDEPDNVDVVLRALRKEYEVVGCSSPREALQLLDGSPFDLVIVDQRMPEHTGTEVLERARAKQPSARRVILSGFTHVADLITAINTCQVHRFLSKPIDPELVLATVRQLVPKTPHALGACVVVDDDDARAEGLARALAEASGGALRVSANTDVRAARPDLTVLVEPESSTRVELTVQALGGAERGASALIVVARPGAVTDAAAYLTAGADDVMWPPARPDEVLLRLRTLQLRRQAERELRRLRTAVGAQQARFELIGNSPAMQEVFGVIERVGPTSANVLICGETGTGKELVARALHAASPRRDAPFVAVNLSALPETLVEAELFGYEAGAFTGARNGRPGRLELVDRGTLFLDEMGDLPASVQVKLLRILQERKFERLGSTQSRETDFRLICATHRNVRELVTQGALREDLYYRINTVQLDLPPLRERREDVVPLAEHFLVKFMGRTGLRKLAFGEDAIKELVDHDWPGNVRELEHDIERAVALASEGDVLGKGIVAVRGSRRSFRSMVDSFMRGGRSLDELLFEIEREILVETLARYDGNQTAAARKLQVPRSTMRSRLKRLGL